MGDNSKVWSVLSYSEGLIWEKSGLGNVIVADAPNVGHHEDFDFCQREPVGMLP